MKNYKTKDLSVFVGMITVAGERTKGIVATISPKKASSLLGLAIEDVHEYDFTSVDRRELELVKKEPNTIFISSHRTLVGYKKLR